MQPFALCFSIGRLTVVMSPTFPSTASDKAVSEHLLNLSPDWYVKSTSGAMRPRLLVTGFRPGPGGINRFMLNLINDLAQAGVEIHLQLESEDHPDLAMVAPSVQAHVARIGYDRQAPDRMQAFLTRLQPHTVLSHRDRANRLVLDAAATMEPRPRVVIRVGTTIPAKLRQSNLLSRRRKRRELIATLRRVDLVIGVSEGVCDGVRQLLGPAAPAVRRIYTGLDLAQIRTQAEQEPAHPWCRDRSGPLLISLGRLVKAKDQGTMLRALALLPRDHRLIIYGEGKRRLRLKSLAERLGVAARCDLPGRSENPFPCVARADLFLLSSRFEGFPNALLEATALGVPAVATDCSSGPRELLDGGRYGELVPIGDAQAMAAAIRRTLNNPPTQAHLVEALDRLAIHRATELYLDALGFGALTRADRA